MLVFILVFALIVVIGVAVITVRYSNSIISLTEVGASGGLVEA